MTLTPSASQHGAATHGPPAGRRQKQRAAGVSVGSNVILVLSKLAVGLLTNSVAIISEAVHSAMDLLAAVIAFVAVSLSDKPPDADHPHGHEKIEDLSGAVEALLIFGAVLFIGYEAIEKLVHGSKVERLWLGVGVMGGSAAVNTVVSFYLERVGRRTDSVALLADAAHLRTDVYTSVGVMLGLGLVQLTGIHWLDPVTAMLVALLIVREAWIITRRTVGDLLDQSLPDSEQSRIEATIRALGLSFHELRSRRAGASRKIDLHLEVSPTATAEQVHEVCDHIEAAVQREFPGAQLMIHPEPRMDLDPTRTVAWWVDEILKNHKSLFLAHSAVHIHDGPGGPHVALKLHVPASEPVAAGARVVAHLESHIVEHIPAAHVYMQLEPVPRLDPRIATHDAPAAAAGGPVPPAARKP